MSRLVPTQLVRRLVAAAAALVVVGACQASVTSPRPSATRAPHVPYGRFVGSDGHQLQIVDAATGTVVRSFAAGREPDVLAVSGDSRYAFVSSGSFQRPTCTRRVDLTTGATTLLRLCATGLAVSLDGRMFAYTTTGGRHDYTTYLVIRDRRTGRERRTVIFRNCQGCNNGVFGADLSWSPDDKHLAVSIGYTASIVTLQLFRPWAGDVRTTPDIARCNGDYASCMSPTYLADGSLVYTRYRFADFGFSEVRWRGGRESVLFRPGRSAEGDLEAVVDPRSGSFLWQGRGAHGQERTYLWSDGRARTLANYPALKTYELHWLNSG